MNSRGTTSVSRRAIFRGVSYSCRMEQNFNGPQLLICVLNTLREASESEIRSTITLASTIDKLRAYISIKILTMFQMGARPSYFSHVIGL